MDVTCSMDLTCSMDARRGKKISECHLDFFWPMPSTLNNATMTMTVYRCDNSFVTYFHCEWHIQINSNFNSIYRNSQYLRCLLKCLDSPRSPTERNIIGCKFWHTDPLLICPKQTLQSIKSRLLDSYWTSPISICSVCFLHPHDTLLDFMNVPVNKSIYTSLQKYPTAISFRRSSKNFRF